MIDLERLAPDTIRIERVLQAPRDTVWRWLVEPDLRAQWFAGGELQPRVSGEIELVFDHDNLSADDVPYPLEYAAFRCATAHETITAYDPPRLIAFTWDGGAEGVATFELFDDGGRTRLVLTHSGITGPVPMANFAGGWHSHLAVLQAKLSGDVVRNFWELHARSEAAVQAVLRD